MKTLQAMLTRARKSPALRDILRPDYDKLSNRSTRRRGGGEGSSKGSKEGKYHVQ